MNQQEIKTIIEQELPPLLANDPNVRDLILRTVAEYYATKQETESKFKRILEELQSDRAEQSRKWEENNRRLDQIIPEKNQQWHEEYETMIRNDFKERIERFFGAKILSLNEFDDQGEVFGIPDEIDIDVMIKNELVIVCEIKFIVSKSQMYDLNRKVEFYEKRHQRKVNRKLVVALIMDEKALVVARKLGIEAYNSAYDLMSDV